MKPIGFMSENTAAFALMPDLIARLAPYYRRIIPIRFSSTREGARTANESMANQHVKVIAAFARRPKVIHAGDRTILVKINSLLFSSARAGAALGIPVLAGVPLISSLMDFSIGVPCAWFLIEPVKQADVEFYLPIFKPWELNNPGRGISGPLKPEGIASVAASRCRDMNWIQVCDGMRCVKEQDQEYSGFFGGGYWPFFVAITAKEGDVPTTA